jgi:hypothetical protein
MAKDILIAENGAIVTNNGDLVIGDADVQNLQDLAAINRGELKTDPLVGLDLIKLNKKRLPGAADFGFVNQQLRGDGWVNTEVRRENGDTLIKAERSE